MCDICLYSISAGQGMQLNGNPQGKAAATDVMTEHSSGPEGAALTNSTTQFRTFRVPLRIDFPISSDLTILQPESFPLCLVEAPLDNVFFTPSPKMLCFALISMIHSSPKVIAFQ